MSYGGLIVTAGGVFTLVCAAMNFNWFMEHRKARFFVKILGRDGARIFYAVLGLGLVTVGALLLAGVVN